MPRDTTDLPLRRPTPRDPPSAFAPLGRRNLHKRTTDPVGPPTAVLDLATYIERVERALDDASDTVQEVEEGWAALSGEADTRLKNRCSVADLLDQTSTAYDDSWARGDIHQWTNFRWLPPPPAYPHEPEADSDDDIDEPLEALVDPQEEHKAWSGLTLEGHPDVERCFEAVEQSSLNILKPPQVSHFVRKSGLADYNSLPAPRPSKPGGPRSKFQDPLSHLLFTITFHCIPRLNRVHSYSHRQTIVCTGSNTLEQLRANMTVGGANIPVEEPPENEDDGGSGGGGSERGSDEDDGEAQGRRPGASEATPGPLGGGVDEDEGQTRWKNELRETGCAFLAEGFVYPEDDDNKEDYAELILAGIKQVDWPGGPTGASVPPEPSSDSDDELHPLDAEGAAQRARAAVAAAAARPPVRPAVQGKPELQLGPSLANAKLGDLPLRVGQPYLFVHQGNNEHIWTLDEVRYLHPSDPPPFPPATVHPRSNAFLHFVSPYPLTTFLSRTLFAARCSLCRLDPGELHTVDDELAGETPAVLCRTCFDLLHPVPADKRGAPGHERDDDEALPPDKKRKGRAARRRGGAGEGSAVPDSERTGMEGVKIVPLLVEQ